MPQDMGGDVLGGDPGACRGCCGGVDLDALGGGVGAHLPGGAAGGKHEAAGAGRVLAVPLPQSGNGGLLERAPGLSRVTSAQVRWVISDTRGPLVSMRSIRTRSRRPVQVRVSGAARRASASPAVSQATVARDGLRGWMARTRAMRAACSGCPRAA